MKDAPMIFVGGASKDSVVAARVAINDILRSGNAEAVKIAALETLRTLCKVENTSITNCTFTSKP